jgi:uncharacterized protein DUF1573
MKSHVVLLLLSAFVSAAAHAELKWSETTLELHPTFGDKEAVGHFKYQNAGKTPIRLTSVKTSCGCTVPKWQKEEIAPGEKGEITATFNIGNRTGTQVKTVTVQTDEPSVPPAVLTLKAILPEGLILAPTFVYWKVGEAPTAKTILATAGKGYSASKLEVRSQTPDFAATVEPVKGGGAWKILVTPSQTQRNVASVITVQTDFPKENPGIYFVTASVAGAATGQTPASAPRP